MLQADLESKAGGGKQIGDEVTVKVTGGDSGIAWGTGGCWIEPWTQQRAQETVRKLDAWWHRREFEGISASVGSEGMLIRSDTILNSHSRLQPRALIPDATYLLALILPTCEMSELADMFSFFPETSC